MVIGFIRNSRLNAAKYDILSYISYLVQPKISDFKVLPKKNKVKLTIIVKSTISNSYVTFLVGNTIKFMTSAGRIGFSERETKRLPAGNYKIGEKFISFLEKNRSKYGTNTLYIYRTGNKKLFGPFFKNLKIFLKKEYYNWQKKLVPVLSNILRVYWRYLFLVMQSSSKRKNSRPLRRLGPHETFSFMELLTHAFGKNIPFPFKKEEDALIQKPNFVIPHFSGERTMISPQINSDIEKRDKVTIPFSDKKKVLRLLRRYKRLYSPSIKPLRLSYLRSFSSYPFNGCKRRWKRAIPRYW